ncbi:hypothetical protein [Oxynema sp. CENA135]|nr:hypothetical protein [Oxynema sp. CENA135]
MKRSEARSRPTTIAVTARKKIDRWLSFYPLKINPIAAIAHFTT